MGKNKLLDFVADMDVSDLKVEFAPSSRVEKLIGKITVKTLDAKTLDRISKKNTDKKDDKPKSHVKTLTITFFCSFIGFLGIICL